MRIYEFIMSLSRMLIAIGILGQQKIPSHNDIIEAINIVLKYNKLPKLNADEMGLMDSIYKSDNKYHEMKNIISDLRKKNNKLQPVASDANHAIHFAMRLIDMSFRLETGKALKKIMEKIIELIEKVYNFVNYGKFSEMENKLGSAISDIDTWDHKKLLAFVEEERLMDKTFIILNRELITIDSISMFYKLYCYCINNNVDPSRATSHAIINNLVITQEGNVVLREAPKKQ